MTCRMGKVGDATMIVCDVRSGGWRVGSALRPWCCVEGDPPVRVLWVWIFGGYGGQDYICGYCGQYWSDDGEVWRRTMAEEEREANKAKVAAVPDPKCWKCHDTGDQAMPLAEEPEPCECGAEQKKEGR